MAAGEMETAGLYTVAVQFNVRALAIPTINNSLVTNAEVPVEERERSFTVMIERALQIAD